MLDARLRVAYVSTVRNRPLLDCTVRCLGRYLEDEDVRGAALASLEDAADYPASGGGIIELRAGEAVTLADLWGIWLPRELEEA